MGESSLLSRGGGGADVFCSVIAALSGGVPRWGYDNMWTVVACGGCVLTCTSADTGAVALQCIAGHVAAA
jgi:hypothetical protein